MIVKISGETPFQVLSTQFSIGPSTSGYDLYFSADGVNYTQLFTVGANVNRQVTQVAAGSYYKLVGNTGNVVVNWYGNCVVDNGGGGGSYVLPVASQSTLGGVKIGSGITIDSGGTISAQGGDNNYYIVNDLSGVTTPTEGKMAYVKEHTTNTYNGTKIYIDDFEDFTENTEGRAESYLARVHWGDWDSTQEGPDDKLVFPIYQSGKEFFWDFENDGEFHDLNREREGEYYKIRYRAFGGDDDLGSEAYIEIYPIDETPYGDYIITYSNYVTGETIVYEEKEPGAKYTYKIVGEGEAWVKQQDSHYLYIGDENNPEASEDDRIAFYNAVMANVGDNWYMDITRDGQTARYNYVYTSADKKPVFCYDAGSGVRMGYALNADGTIEFYHDDRPDIPGQAFIQVDSGGTIHTDGLSNLTSEQYYRFWLRYIADSQYGEGRQDTSNAPLKYCYRQYEEISDEVKLVYYIGGEIYIGGTLYKGAWHFIEWEWGDQPLAADTWTTV